MRMILNKDFFRLFCLLGCFTCIFLLLPSLIRARQLISVEEALNITFSEAQIFERESIYLTKEEVKRIQNIHPNAKIEIKSRLIIRYKAIKNKRVIGYSYVDTHRVRTLSETILISIDKDHQIKRVEIINFNEPSEYLAPNRWLEQFRNQQNLNGNISDKEIYGITGASLTASAIQKAVLRILALHLFIEEL